MGGATVVIRQDSSLPWGVRWHLWRSGHKLATFNPRISTPSWDPGAKGLLIVCECGAVWAY